MTTIIKIIHGQNNYEDIRLMRKELGKGGLSTTITM